MQRPSVFLRSLLVGAVVLGGVLGSGPRAAAQTLELASEVPVFMAMYLARLAPEGSYRACLEDYVAQGFGVEKALDACAVKADVPFERGDGLDPAGLGWQAAPPIFPGSPCGVAFDSRLAQGTGSWTRPPTPAEKIIYKLEDGQQMYTDDARKQMQAKLDADYEQAKSERLDAQRAFDAAAAYYKSLADDDPNKHRALKEMLELSEALGRKEKAEQEAKEKKDAGPPEHTEKAVSKTDPNGVNPCSDITAFFAQCTANGWTTPECKDLQSRMQRCGDPTYTDPPRDSVASETTDTSGGGTGPVDTFGCSLPPVDAAEVALVVCLKEWQVAQPAPGQEPCAPVLTGSGEPYHVRAYRYRYGQPFDPSNPPPYCGDPRALTEEGACTGTLTLVEFGQKDLQALAWEAALKLGGPIVILPMPAPPGPPPPVQ